TSSCRGAASSSTRRARTSAYEGSSSSSRAASIGRSGPSRWRRATSSTRSRGGPSGSSPDARRPILGRERVSVRVGIDVGGTFTDLVAIDPASGVIRSRKVLTTPDAPARGVLGGLQALAPDAGSIAHGSTIVTNAIVEGRHAPTALVTTRGFRDVLEIARQS